MAGHAIVIGIDRYSNPAWSLQGAVKDALAFHRWSTTAGGVKPENVRLLLSTDDAQAKALATAEATRGEIRKVILEYQEGAGKGGDRLYFFYAGHGLSAPGVTKGGRQEPVIVPADLTNLKVDSDLLISFSEIMPCFVDQEPYEQFFFLDACRDFGLEEHRSGIGSVGPWIPPATEGKRRSSQHVLYATSPGQKAYEASIGVFTSVLLEGLAGKGVEMTYVQATHTFQVRFPKLAKFVIQNVAAAVARKIPQNAAKYVQVPQQQTHGDSADPILAELAEDAVGNYPVRVRVSPAAALAQCRVSAKIYLPRLPNPVEYAGEGPPATLPVKFELPPQDYSISATAPGYDEATAPCALYKSSEVELALQPAAPPAAPDPEPMRPLAPPRPPRRGLREHDGHALALPSSPQDTEPEPTRAPERAPARGSREGPRGRPREGPTTGRLEIRSEDSMAELLVQDGAGAEVLRGRGLVSGQLAPGLYRVQLVAAQRARTEELVEVKAGSDNRRSLAPPPPRLGATQLALLRRLEMVREGSSYVYTSAGQSLADVRLASLLAFAAFAETSPAAPEVELLRGLGIKVPKESPAVLSIVGASGDAPFEGMTAESFVQETSVTVFDAQQRTVARQRHEPLPAFPVAAQHLVPIEPGTATVRLELPGLEPTHYALACLPGRVTVILVVSNDDGSVDAQQYLLPAADARRTPNPALNRLTAAHLRRVEIAQRSYARTAEVPADVVGDLLRGSWIDPLMGCVAGYALLRRGDRKGFEVAAKNMLKHFARLPDSHVLAALEWPEAEDEHFAQAAQRGTPVFAEGFRALLRWREKKALPVAPETLDIAEGLLPTSPWTAWVLNRPALAVHDDGTLDAAASGWEVLERDEPRIATLARSVGRVDVGGRAYGTGFVSEPSTVLVPAFLLDGVHDGTTLSVPVQVTFAANPGDAAAKQYRVRGIAGIDSAKQLIRLRLDDGGAVPPLPRAEAAPPAHSAVYIVSYPSGVRPGQERQQKSFDGTKRVSPGRLLGQADERGMVEHNCTTGLGSAGGAVVDLASHRVVGIHQSAEMRDALKIGGALLL